MDTTKKLPGDARAPFPAASATPCARRSIRQTLVGGLFLGGDTLLRMNPAFSLLAASLIAFLPVHASAQTQPEGASREEAVSVRDRARPEYDPLGARLGGFNLNATLDLGVTSTDNLFAAASGSEEEDTIFTVAPSAGLTSNWSRHELAFDAGASWVTHDDFDNEDFDTHYLRGRGRLDIGDSSSVGASARITHQVTPRTDPDTPAVGNPVEYDRTDFAVNAEHRFARFRVRADAGTSEYDYEGLQNFRDNDETTFRGRIEAEISPRIGIVLQGTVDERSYDNSPAFDSEGQAILIGASINGNLFSGEVLVGQFERDYDAGVSADGLAVAAALEWYLTRLTTITLTARRDADDQISATAGLPYVTNAYGARVDHELLRNVILTGGIQAGQREYDTLSREDDFVNVEVGADYLLNRRVALRARYNFDETDSSGALPGRDFEANAVSLGLSLRL
jgi:hypothetical protein